MRKKSKIISFIWMVALLVSFSASMTVFAAEKSIDVADTKGYYIYVTGVVEEKAVGTDTIYVAGASAKVTFIGEGLSRESIAYLPDARIEDGSFVEGDSFESVVFTVKKYYPTLESGDTYNELVREPQDIPYYVHGNYAVLSKPGYYLINGAMEASMGTTIIVQITGNPAPAQPTAEPTAKPVPQPTPQPTAEPAAELIAEPAASVPAAPTSSKVLVDGKLTQFEAYNINGSNYFKLRDLAQAVNGSAKNFEIGWDAAKNAISLTSSKAYTAVGGELAVSANPAAAQAASTTSKIYLDGKEVRLTAYNIAGNNYFKLRDIGKAINFNVTWDEATNTISIDTSAAYKE